MERGFKIGKGFKTEYIPEGYLPCSHCFSIQYGRSEQAVIRWIQIFVDGDV